MKYPLLLATILLATLCNTLDSWAKKDAIITLKPISKLKGNVSFDSIVVMDFRTEKGSIGQVQDVFKRLDVVIQDSLSIALKNFAQQMIVSAAVKQNNKLLVLVKDLEYKDRIQNNSNAVSTIYLRLDCYLGDDEYRHALSIDSLYEYPSARQPDKLAALNGNLNYLFTMMIESVAESHDQHLPPQSIEQLLSAEKMIRSTISVYNSAPQKGVYYTTKQFLDNIPADTNCIHERVCDYENVLIASICPKKKRAKRKRVKTLSIPVSPFMTV
jgi:hypothetical protein